MAKNFFNIDEIAFGSYYKIEDDSKTVEIAPFIITNKKVVVDNNNKYNYIYWKMYESLFNQSNVSIIDENGVQNQKLVNKSEYFYPPHTDKTVNSSIIFNGLTLSSDIILKMPLKIREQLLTKKDLRIRDILSIYNFVCQNKEILKLNNLIQEETVEEKGHQKTISFK